MNKKTLNIQEYELPITLNQDNSGGYVAVCRTWPECYAQGDTLEDAINEITSVATTLIELYQEEEMDIPIKLKKSSTHPSDNLELNFPVVVSVN